MKGMFCCRNCSVMFTSFGPQLLHCLLNVKVLKIANENIKWICGHLYSTYVYKIADDDMSCLMYYFEAHCGTLSIGHQLTFTQQKTYLTLFPNTPLYSACALGCMHCRVLRVRSVLHGCIFGAVEGCIPHPKHMHIRYVQHECALQCTHIGVKSALNRLRNSI